MLGLNIAQFTLIHTMLSVVGIMAGLVVAGALMAGRKLDGWNALFLATTILTSISGFGFPFVSVLPAHIIGGLSLVIAPLVAYALFGAKLAGAWRTVWVVGSVVLLYFNAFVLVTQLFRKIPVMLALAPNQKEPPFAITQILLLVMFIALGRSANRGFKSLSQ